MWKTLTAIANACCMLALGQTTITTEGSTATGALEYKEERGYSARSDMFEKVQDCSWARIIWGISL